MPLRMIFTTTEREQLGILVNNFSVFATQLLAQTGADLAARALANLAKVKKDQEDFLKRLDELAREQNDESPLRLIEDVRKMPADTVQMLSLVRRCLFASAFLGHLLAQPTHPQAAAEALSQEKRLH